MTTQYWFACYHDETKVSEIIPHEPVDSCFQKAGPYPSVEECRLAMEVLPNPCPKCGGLAYGQYAGTEGELMKTTGMCFTCAFWANLLANPQPGRMVVDGHHFISVEAKGGPRGACGGKFSSLSTGEVVTASNVWHQGKIPPWWKADFPETHTRS